MIPEPSSDATTEPETVAAGAPVDGGTTAPAEQTGAPGEPAVPDDEAVLDQLEADLTAVEHAIATLDRVTAEGEGGEAAAQQIAVAVSAARFGVEAPGSPD